MICLDTRGLCFLCYKSCDDSISSENLGSVDGDESFDSGRTSDQDDSDGESHFYNGSSDSNSKNYGGIATQTNLFCKNLFRVLDFQPQDQHKYADKKRKISKHNDKQLQICTDCLRIASNVCEICHEINSLQLLLNWKLMRIRDTMRAADKAPSRSSAFKNVFKCAKESKSSQSESPKADRRLPQEEFNEIQSLRKNIIHKCTERLQNAKPKVFLTRLKQDNQKENPEELQGKSRDQNDQNNCSGLHINTTDKTKDDVNLNKCETIDHSPQSALDKYNCSKCSKSFSKEKSLLSHLKKHPNGGSKDEKEQICCDEFITTEAAVLEAGSLKSIADTGESDSLLELPVEVETNTATPECSKPHDQVEKSNSEQEEEEEPPPVPIEIDTKLAQKKESDNDEDFRPSDVDADDISSDECGLLESNFSTEKKEGRKRKKKANVKTSSYGVKDGRTSKKLKL
ncbi:unnamed protein product [Orchesella dallaii]|uniref:C2H2-type domain-containing protein n=1 Tax=Orchesella dallaii TaxID=48710 RepID=A0ABP1RZV7_9HEXA